MAIIADILAIIAAIAGIAGCLLPAIPGPPLSYASILILYLFNNPNYGITGKFLIVWIIIVAAVTIIDYVAQPYFTKITGGSKLAVRCSIAGLVAGMVFFPPIGIIIGPFIGIPVPITVVQMLWINMIMDTLSGLAFSYEPALFEYMCEEPKKKSEGIINKYMFNQILTTGLYSSILCIFFLKNKFINGMFGDDLMTAFFGLIIFISIFIYLPLFYNLLVLNLEEDLLLSEYGVYDFTGEDLFYYDLVRQYPDGEDEYFQLRVSIMVSPDEENRFLQDTLWSDDSDENFFDYIKKSDFLQ